eukprot:1539405-Rhodomonas_salina.1
MGGSCQLCGAMRWAEVVACAHESRHGACGAAWRDVRWAAVGCGLMRACVAAEGAAAGADAACGAGAAAVRRQP